MGLPLAWLDIASDRGLIEPCATRIEPPDLGCSEAEFQTAVVALAVGHGFKCYHTRDSRGSQKGFLDWVFVRERLVIAELKKVGGRMRPEQRVWLAALRAANVEAYLWTAAEWDSVVETLTGVTPR